jgi:hypothetical protein
MKIKSIFSTIQMAEAKTQNSMIEKSRLQGFGHFDLDIV